MLYCVKMKLSVAIVLVLLAVTVYSAEEKKKLALNKVTQIPKDGFQNFISSPDVSMVYFYTTDKHSSFVHEFDKSASYLENYSVQLGIFDCRDEGTVEAKCQKEDVDSYVYTYQAGIDLLALEVDTMFDVNSIMSRALELALLEDVPILSSQLEKQDLEKSLVGQKDIILGYFDALGTAETRIFYEIAYTFKEYFKFAITPAEKVVEGLQGNQDLQAQLRFWVLYCSKTTSEELAKSGDCENLQYRGKLTLAGMMSFVQELREKPILYCPEDDIDSVIESSKLPLIFINTNKKSQERSQPIIDYVAQTVRGLAKVIILDFDQKQCRRVAERLNLSNKVPDMSMQRKDGEVMVFDAEAEFNRENVSFVLEQDREIFHLGTAAISPQRGDRISLSNDDVLELEKLIEEVETQDDEVADSVFQLREKELKFEFIPALDKKSFNAAVKSWPLKLVLFYLPFDSVGVAFLHDFGAASEVLAKNHSETSLLASVNCFDATDLCAQENITTYPVLKFYRQGSDRPQIYIGPLDATAVVNAVMLSKIASPVELKSETEVEDFMSGEFPTKLSQFSPASFVLLTTDVNSDAMKTFQDVSSTMNIFAPFGFITGDLAKNIGKIYDVSVPSVVARNRADPNKPVRKLDVIDELTLKDFVKQSLIPAVPELTVMNFPTLFSRRQPLAIMFVDKQEVTTDETLDILTEVAMSGDVSGLTFCWMNAAPKSLGEKILSEYTKTAVLPVLSVVDHSKASVFTFQPEDKMSSQNVLEWLKKVMEGKEKPSRKLYEKEWGPPGRYYDFLAFQDMLPNKVSQVDEESQEPHIKSAPEIDEPFEEETREKLVQMRRSRFASSDGSDKTAQGMMGHQEMSGDVTPDQHQHHTHGEL